MYRKGNDYNGKDFTVDVNLYLERHQSLPKTLGNTLGGSTHFREGETEAYQLGLGLDDRAESGLDTRHLSSRPARSERDTESLALS